MLDVSVFATFSMYTTQMLGVFVNFLSLLLIVSSGNILNGGSVWSQDSEENYGLPLEEAAVGGVLPATSYSNFILFPGSKSFSGAGVETLGIGLHPVASSEENVADRSFSSTNDLF